MSFWDNLSPLSPEPDAPMGGQAAYQAYQRGRSGSAIYRPPGPSAPRQNIYEGGEQYGGLTQYTSQKADPLDRKPGQSIEGWRRNVMRVARALPADEVEAKLAAIDQAEQQEQAPEHPSDRAENLGILGMAPTARAAALGSRHGGRQVEARGTSMVEQLAANRPMSMAEVNAALRQREQAMQTSQPQRTEIPAGSSGTGIFTR